MSKLITKDECIISPTCSNDEEDCYDMLSN